MATSARQQDLPPEGGYRPINYARIPAKKFFSGKLTSLLLLQLNYDETFCAVCLYVLNISGSTMLLGYVGVTAVAGYVYFLTWRKVRQDNIEMRSGKLALQPLLMAERDREYVYCRIVPGICKNCLNFLYGTEMYHYVY
jgi:NADH dehydrogenase (ubiquinone) 1 alpha subcomplex subunit 13